MTAQTDRRNSHFGLWALLIALTAFGGSISAQSRQGGSRGVTVYADPNFSGQSVSFRNDMPNLASSGWNDKISSIRIPSGETWEMCQDADYRNHCQVLSGDVADLRGMGWNDRISSLRRVDSGRQWGGTFDNRIGITVYADPNFKGQSATFGDDTPNVDRLNDKISSIRIPNGEAWEVCQDTDYRNQCQVLSGDVADLRGMGWNDRISSLRRVNSGRRARGAFENYINGITVYADPNFSGQSASFRDDTPNLGSDRWNDKISSIRIPNGEAWEVCQDADYRNQCQVLSGNVADLRSMGWNDRISSLRRVNNGRRSGGTFDNRVNGITVYADPNFSGQSASFRDDMPDLVSYGWNDKISSIRIPGGETWELCQDVDYRNQCQVLSGDVADLRAMGWNDRISSLRAVSSSGYRDRPSEGVFQYNVEQSLLFYDRGGFTGASTIVTGRSSNVGLSARQGSVQLRGGGSWELCDSSGRCATISQDVADVSRLGLNGRITSARIVETSPYRRDR